MMAVRPLEMQGRAVQALWDDIDAINSQARERTGYPTQKPLALLERIIKAGSIEGYVAPRLVRGPRYCVWLRRR
jgi:hypothetical protein